MSHHAVWRAALSMHSPRSAYLISLYTLLVTTIGVWLLQIAWQFHWVSPLFILCAVGCAASLSAGPAIVNALGGIVAYLLIIIPPVGALHLQREEDLVRLLIFIVGILGGTSLVSHMRQRLLVARREQAALSQLYEFSQAIGAALTPQSVAGPLVATTSSLLGGAPCRLLIANASGEPLREAANQGSWQNTPNRTTITLHHEGIILGQFVVGHAAANLPPTERRLLDLLARQATLALERCQLVQRTIDADRLAQADQVKAALLAAVAHEIKTPLTSLRAASEELCNPSMAWSPDAVATFTAVIGQEARRLDGLLGALLDHTRIAAGPLPLALAPVDLRTLLAGVVRQEHEALYGHPLQLELPDAPLEVDCDPVMLGRTLANLLRNAGRHTPAGTPITVRAEANARGVTIAVIDAGPGLPPSMRRQPASQPGARDHQGAPGLGLGLAICAGFISAHGGSLSLDETLGGGLTATIHLPHNTQTIGGTHVSASAAY